MKKALLLFATLCMAAIGFAQQPFATLTHNDTIRVFYGNNALSQAHSAAVGGDVITLSQGSFYSVNITKAVTIRGAGMFHDEVAGTNATVLQNDFSINVSDTVNRLSIIGIWHNNIVRCTTAYRPQFIKCRFNQFETPQSVAAANVSYAIFVNCIIRQWKPQKNGNRWIATNTVFQNSIILDQYNHDSPDRLINCVARQHNAYDYLNNKLILNSVLYYGYANSGQCSPTSANAYTSFNSIGINYCSSYSIFGSRYFNMTNASNNNLYNFPSSDIPVVNNDFISRPFSMVFKYFRGSYTDGMSMELQDSIATTIMGNDSTQVGIYGGQCPWDPSVNNPLIGHIRAARRTNAAGLLEVDVEILDDEESDSSNTNSGSDNE